MTDHDPAFHGHLTARDMAASDRVTAELNALPVEDRHTTAYSRLLSLGFVADLGVAWTRTLPTGLVAVVAGVDEHGEPDEVSADGRAHATLLRDPDDFDTVVESVPCASLDEAIATVQRWAVDADPLGAMVALLRGDGVTVEVLP